MTKVLFVCLGNICRSPLAEGLFRQKVEAAGLQDKYNIDSAGTSDYHIGELPDKRTRVNAVQNGLELTSRGRQFRKQDFLDFDIILVMDRSNHRNVKVLEPALAGEIASVYMMRDFDAEDRGAEVPDPYHGGEQGFQNVFEILDRSTAELLRLLEDEEVQLKG